MRLNELEDLTKRRKKELDKCAKQNEKLREKNQVLQDKILSLGTQRMRDRSNERLKGLINSGKSKKDVDNNSESDESSLMMRNRQLRDEIEKVHVRLRLTNNRLKI